MPAWLLPAIATGVGALGTLFGGGKPEESKTTVELSPEQKKFLQFLQSELGRDAFDVSGLLQTTKERFGSEASGMRQAALQRLTRAGVSPLQTEMTLSDINVPFLRQMGSTLAEIQFGEIQAEEGRRLDIMGKMGGVLGGTGTTTSKTYAPSGLGFSQLFGAGLQGLFSTVGGGTKSNINQPITGYGR